MSHARSSTSIITFHCSCHPLLRINIRRARYTRNRNCSVHLFAARAGDSGGIDNKCGRASGPASAEIATESPRLGGNRNPKRKNPPKRISFGNFDTSVSMKYCLFNVSYRVRCRALTTATDNRPQSEFICKSRKSGSSEIEGAWKGK